VRCPGLESGTHRIGDFFDAEVFADARPYYSTRLAANPTRRIALLQKPHRVIGPQQFNERARISPRVLLLGTHYSEFQLLALGMHMQQPPPRRDKPGSDLQEPIAYHQSRPVQNPPIYIDLFAKTAQAVAIRLDLVAVQQTVHHGDVESYAATTQSQLLDDDRLGIPDLLFAQPEPKSRTDRRITEVSGSLLQPGECSGDRLTARAVCGCRMGIQGRNLCVQIRDPIGSAPESWPRNPSPALGATSCA